MTVIAAPLCGICARRVASYVCQDCGRTVCNNCIDPIRWSCSECQAKLSPAAVQRPPSPSQFSIATWLFFIAFAAIFTGMLLMAFGSLSNISGASGGAIILIGPIPIILGGGPYSAALVALAAVLTIFALVFFFILKRRG